MSIKTKGFKELALELEELPKNIARGAARRAMKRAADDMAAEQKRLAPVDDGDLVESIRVQLRSRNLTGLSNYASVLRAGGTVQEARSALRSARRVSRQQGVRSTTRISATIGASAPHAHLVEFGTGPRAHKSGRSTGVMPANPFMRPAFDNEKDHAVETIKAGLSEEIEKSKGRIARRIARSAIKG